MVRAPCCEKMGLKKGPWTHQEDRILIDYINLHGHPNWRALPKHAGLLRCGKSCRLRWTNYLNPDIKRGNFSREEEDTIIQLHTAMGNRWSAIAARLPGRTDNEIKNVWHTHLKKRLINPNTNSTVTNSKSQPKVKELKEDEEDGDARSSPLEMNSSSQTSYNQIGSPQPSSTTEISSVTSSTNDNSYMEYMGLDQNLPEMDEEFWSEIFSGENSEEFPAIHENIGQLQSGCGFESNVHDDLDFWYSVFTRGEEVPQI